MHPEAWSVQNEMKFLKHTVYMPKDYLLETSDFEVMINPQIHAQTKIEEFDWEYCLSFPGIRCMVRRPRHLEVSYLNEQGDEVERVLDEFEARVFLHELDHINGRTMTHWRASEGNIDVITESPEETNPNLMTTVDFYKNKIDDLKS